jgi:O-antigen/teichoic acid export membrane protein
LTDYKTIGLYDLGYRFAGILNMFLIIPFGYAFLPKAYKIFGQKDDKRYYSKLMTYLTFVLVWAGLALSLFSKEIIENFTFNQAYQSAYIVVPVIVLSYIFSGMRNIALLGMLLTKNTKYIAYITLFVATLNVIFNFIFIPIWGMMVAAYSTLAAFIVYYFLSVKLSDRFYKIPFEQKKLSILLILGVGLYVVAIFVSGINFLILIILKLLLIVIFPIVLYYLKFYEEVELNAIIRYYKSAKIFVYKTIIRLKGKE